MPFTQNQSGTEQDVFTLTNGTTNDQVALLAGHTYAMEVWAPYSGNVFGWLRAGVVAPDGQMMFTQDATGTATAPPTANPGSYPDTEGRITIASAGFAGGAPRTGGLALYAATAVPEPGTVILFSLAVPALALAARRRGKIE